MPVVDRDVRPGRKHEFRLFRAADRRQDAPGAKMLRKLDRIMPDRARSAGDQDGLSTWITTKRERMQCGRCGYSETGAHFEGDVVGQCGNEIFRHDHVFAGGASGSSPGCVEYPDPFSHPAWIDAFTNRIDKACAIAVRRAWKRPGGWNMTAANLDVGGIDAGSLQSDPNLTGTDRRRFDVDKFKDL